jgi:hypothetical protein
LRTDRIATNQVSRENYGRAFVAGILPREAEAFAEWCRESADDGGRYVLPTRDEWLALYDELKAVPARALDELLDALPLTPRLHDLLGRLDEVARSFAPLNNERGHSRAEQMFLRQGLFEWVTCRESGKLTWGGLGQPGPGLGGRGLYSLDQSRRPQFLSDADTKRDPSFGFRLIRKEV